MTDIRLLSSEDKVEKLMDYINDLVEEDTFLIIDSKVDQKTETEWKKNALMMQEKNIAIFLVAYNGDDIIGLCRAQKLRGKQAHNVEIGISVSKEYRNHGLGQKMMDEIIRLIRERLEHKRIFLSVFSGNKAALHLYEKLGFRKIAALSGWVFHAGRYQDKIFMELAP